uniref:Uncharacterized protein n=1 Tax=Prymnesium polylepis TaxID=72548 RepID=A0A7S4IM94_9EUKA
MQGLQGLQSLGILKMQGPHGLQINLGMNAKLPDEGPTVRIGPVAGAVFSLGNALDHVGRTINGTGRAMGNPLKSAGRKLMEGATGVHSDVYNIRGYSDTMQPGVLAVGEGLEHHLDGNAIENSAWMQDAMGCECRPVTKRFHSTLTPFIAVDVIVPPGAAAGDIMQIDTPAGWLNVQVPPKLAMGDVFRVCVQTPTVGAGAVPSHQMLPNTSVGPWAPAVRAEVAANDVANDSSAAVLWSAQSWQRGKEF